MRHLSNGLVSSFCLISVNETRENVKLRDRGHSSLIFQAIDSLGVRNYNECMTKYFDDWRTGRFSELQLQLHFFIHQEYVPL